MEVTLKVVAKIKEGDYKVGISKLEYGEHAKVIRKNYVDEDYTLQELKLVMIKEALEEMKKPVTLNLEVKGAKLDTVGKGKSKRLREEIKALAEEKEIEIIQEDTLEKSAFYNIDSLMLRYLEDLGYAERRIFLEVPFEEKDIVRQRGAKWDAYKKKWYCMPYQIKSFRNWAK